MSKHTDLLHALGEYTLNQWLAVGVKLGGPEMVDKVLACSQLTCEIETIWKNRYSVKANYLSLKDAIVAGKYGYVNDYITAENFELEDCAVVIDDEFTFFHPNRVINSDDAVREMNQFGLCPATLLELCAFGEKYPDMQRKFPIVALASVCVSPFSGSNVPYLGFWSGKRKLRLAAWDSEWFPDYRFLAARKQSLAV